MRTAPEQHDWERLKETEDNDVDKAAGREKAIEAFKRITGQYEKLNNAWNKSSRLDPEAALNDLRT